MDAENVNEEESHHTAETLARRFAWLIGISDKNLDRFDAVRRTSYQKATWTLAVATGFIGFSGLAKGDSIGETIYKLIDNQAENIKTIECIALAATLLLILTYFALLYLVIKVYSPKRVEYPTSLISEDMGPPVSEYDDKEKNKKFNSGSWKNAVEGYVKPDDLLNNRQVLKDYISVQTEHLALNRQIDKDLKYAFRLMWPLVIFSFALFFLV